MLKRFLKFLKGNTPQQDFDGSYLDHLLGQVYPRADAHLDECPEHDPLLLVITEILRLTKPDQWNEGVECPLTDDQSPALVDASPPPAPVGEPDESPDEEFSTELDDDGFEIVESSEVIEEVEDSEVEVVEDSEVEVVEDSEVEVVDEDEPAEEKDDREEEEDDDIDIEVVDDSDQDEQDDESDEALEEAEDQDEDSNEEQDQTEEQEQEQEEDADEDDAVHVDAPPSPPPAPAAGLAESSHVEEIVSEMSEVSEADASDELDVPGQKPPALDTPEVLQAGRIFLGLLIENDRLPVDMQLSVAETMLARDLLLGYFVHDDHFEDNAKELLALVEQKFNEGAFSQARILLQLFQTDRPTRINNDRNLFYEDMILRLGIRRRHLINQTVLAELQEHVQVDDFDERLHGTMRWLDETLHVKFHLFTREPEAVDKWRELAAKSRRQNADDIFLRYIPPKRWRRAYKSSLTPTERVVGHISAATVKQYVLRQIKACYFVLRAVGDTGLEPYLDVFFDWTNEKFDLNSVRMMPLLYRQTMSDTQLIDKIFEEMFRRFFKRKTADYLASFDDEAILEAANDTLDALGGLDFNRIPPGNYDLGGLILDRLFGIEYHEPEFAFKLHRLT